MRFSHLSMTLAFLILACSSSTSDQDMAQQDQRAPKADQSTSPADAQGDEVAPAADIAAGDQVQEDMPADAVDAVRDNATPEVTEDLQVPVDVLPDSQVEDLTPETVEFEPVECDLHNDFHPSCEDYDPCTCDLCIGGYCASLPSSLAPPKCGLPLSCCIDGFDCPDPDNPCTVVKCYGGICEYTSNDAGREQCQCHPAGGHWVPSDAPLDQCCSPLVPVSNCCKPTSDGECECQEECGVVCTKCGNGKCDVHENHCNCAEDCSIQQDWCGQNKGKCISANCPPGWDTVTLGGCDEDHLCCILDLISCLGEGAAVPAAQDAIKCCIGLTAVSDCVNEGDGEPQCNCTDQFLCTLCGDGICGTGENLCNCPDDCD